MKIRPKQILTLYFNSWWFPALVSLAALAAFAIAAVSSSKHFAIVINAIIIVLGLSFLGILSAAIWNFIKKRWAKGIINLLMFAICTVAVVFVLGFLMVASMFGPSEDGFADYLVIPENIEISEPQDEFETSQGGPEDTFQASLLKALESPGNEDPYVTAEVTSLIQLQQKDPDILKRYLSTSPSWRVFRSRRAVFATRRWVIRSKWQYNLHGYYTRHTLDIWSKLDMPDFQLRFTVGFSGKPWARVSGDSTRMQQGQTRPLKLSVGNQMHESHCVITADDLIVEVFEQSDAKERRLTKAALAYFNEELNPLVKTQSWETIKAAVPPGSIKRGEPSFELRNSFQPGIYDSEIWINPGEPGLIYLKAFEVTHERSLSAVRLKERSNEWIGWSSDPSELFLSNTNFKIYEGDWGKPYAARLEVWFVPDSGAPERQLMDKVFKIEGWQR